MTEYCVLTPMDSHTDYFKYIRKQTYICMCMHGFSGWHVGGYGKMRFL